MPIYDDDFQSYALGAGVPFGNWLLVGGAITNQIVAGSGPSGTTKSYRLVGIVEVDPTVTGFQTSFSTFLGIRKLSGTSGVIANFANGPNLSGSTFSLVTVQVEKDATVSLIGPDSTVIANSIDSWFEYNVVNFFQVNVQLSDVLVGSVLMIGVNVQVGLNGRQILSKNYTSAVPVAQLVNGTSQVNRVQLVSTDAFYSAFTLESLQSMVSYPHPGTPHALVNQGAIELAALPDTGKIRVIQGDIELAQLPNSGKIRIIQGVIELLILQKQGLRFVGD